MTSSSRSTSVAAPQPLRTSFDGLVALTVLFPFVGVIRGIDIQPNFALLGGFTVLVMLLMRPERGVGRVALQVLLAIGALLALRLVVGENGMNGRYIATYVLACAVPFLMWHLVWRGNLVVLSRLLWFAIFAYVGVGLLQLLVSPGFAAGLVPRPVEDVTALVESGRGVRSLASEPSTFGKVLTYFNVLYLYFALWPAFDRQQARRALWASVFLFGANLVLAQSAYALAIHGLVLLVALWFVDRRGLLVAAAGVTGSVLLLLTFALGGGRLLQVIQAVLSLDLRFLMAQGAFARVMNVPVSLYGAFATFPFGFGNTDLVVPGSIDVFGVPYPFVIGKRNVGGFVEFFLRFGVVGLVMLSAYGIALWRIAGMRALRETANVRLGLVFALSVFLLTFLDGSSADPLAWFTLLVLLRGALERRHAVATPGSLS